MRFKAIKKINAAGVSCSVLTKGVLPIDLLHLSKSNEYGITLISVDEEFRKHMEPGSAPLEARVAALKALHDGGCRTWVSIEPYPTPNIIKQDLIRLLEKVRFVDKIIFGRMNYNKEVTAYAAHKQFFNECAAKVMEYCDSHHIDYHIKEVPLTPAPSVESQG